MTDYTDSRYHLFWSAEEYRQLGAQLGFDFDVEDFRRASAYSDHILGAKRYIPREDAPIELGLPRGVLVRCHLLPRVGVDSPQLDVDLDELISRSDKDCSSLLMRTVLRKDAELVVHPPKPTSAVTKAD